MKPRRIFPTGFCLLLSDEIVQTQNSQDRLFTCIEAIRVKLDVAYTRHDAQGGNIVD